MLQIVPNCQKMRIDCISLKLQIEIILNIQNRNKFIWSLQLSLLFRLQIMNRSTPSTMVAKKNSYSHCFYILFITPCFSRQYHNYGEIRFNQNKLIMSFIIVNNQLLQNNINILISTQFEHVHSTEQEEFAEKTILVILVEKLVHFIKMHNAVFNLHGIQH